MPQSVLDLETLKNQVIRLASSLGLVVVDARDVASKECTQCGRKQGHETRRLDTDLLTVALAWVAARGGRDRALGADLFSDPAWDMLLDLYISHCRNRPVSVSSVSMAARAPATTALRWLNVLVARGLVTRTPDPKDGRRIFLTFTDNGMTNMERALAHALQSDRKLGIGRLHFVQ